MRLAALATLLALATACSRSDPPSPAPAEAPQPAGQAQRYSPFAVILADGGPFHALTLKDVGLRLAPADAALIDEALAEALAARLAAHGARAVHDPTVADPAWHTQCADAHRYVDVWRGSAPPRLGFSVWAGCGSDDRLAWRELPLPNEAALTGPGALAAVEALADALVDTLVPPPAPCPGC